MSILHDNNVEDDSTDGCNCCMAEHPHLDEFFGSIAKDSSAHGIKYTSYRKLHPLERLFWTIIMLASLGGSIYLVERVYSKYNESPVIISFQPNQTAVSQIPFPALTFCNVNILRRSVLTKKYEEVVNLILEYDNKFSTNTTDAETLTKLRRQAMEGIVLIDHLAQFCLSAISFRRRINATLQDAAGQEDFIQAVANDIQSYGKNFTDELRQIEMNNTSFWRQDKSLMRNATFSCEEMLLECMWADERIPCKKLFFHIPTRHGRCCVFNMMPRFLLQKISEDENRAKREMASIPPKVLEEWKAFASEDLIITNEDKLSTREYPKHQKAGGKPYGLTVLVNPSLHEYSTCTANDGIGFKMVAHSPLSSPSIMLYGSALPPGSEIFVDIEPQVTVADYKLLEGIDIEKRGCYLPSDPGANLKHYNYYSTENCLTECLTYHTYKNCSCVLTFMPRNVTQKICGAKNRRCTDEVRVNLTKASGKNKFCHRCLPPCTEILYNLQLSHFDIRQDNVSSYFTYTNSSGQPQNATNYSIVHIYMGTDSLYAMERKTLYEWFDLVANAGGLLSLTLGVSIISFVEVGYFFTLRAWFQFRSVAKEKKEEESEDQSSSSGAVANSEQLLIKKENSVAEKLNKDDNDGYYNWAVRNRLSMIEGAGGVPHVIINGKKRTILF